VTVRLTSAAYGVAPGGTVTLSAAEEKWLVDNGYAHVEPKVAVGPTATYTPAQDPTLAANREDPASKTGYTSVPAYQYGAGDAAALPPRVYSISPNVGPIAGGTVVTLKGDNFTGATGVTFGGVAGTAFTLVTDDEIRVTTPNMTTGGAKAVVVNDPAGNTTVAAGFTAQ